MSTLLPAEKFIKATLKKGELFFFKIKNSVYWRSIRLDKPTGFWLALLPSLWGIAFAYHDYYQLFLYFPLFVMGAVVSRGAGCVINDIIDRNHDKKVTRTAKRPVASGELSVQHATYYALFLAAIALLILLLLPKPAIITGLITFVLIVMYPFMKRITNFPQIFLGLTFNLGTLIGWFTVSPHISITPFILYIAAALWTVGYDTIYACQDKADDKEAGIKSMALRFGDNVTNVVWNIYKVAGLLFGLIGVITHMNIIYFIGWGIVFYHLYWQTQTVDINTPSNCAEKFESNVAPCVIMLVSALIGGF